ncbi:MAG TPA: chorismate mutase, partial [Acidimicrobiales bacterium]|nr:chorismate mutase [Acidimicrobiales bacterium]
MPPAVRALRGATTLDVDEREHLFERVIALLDALFERNGLHHDDLISVLFTATDD